MSNNIIFLDGLLDDESILLENIKKRLPELKKLQKGINEDSCYGDLIYRFYHSSFKVYWIQGCTTKIVNILKELAPKNCTFNSDFEQIFKEGTNIKFKHKHNRNWHRYVRPQLEAFFHAKYFLDQVIKYGKELDKVPECLPGGWAGVLYFYNMR